MNKIKVIIILLSFFVGIQMGYAQQLDQIGKKDAVKLNGGLNINQVYRNSSSYSVAQPYSIVASGNIAASIYGLSVPVSFTWSNYQWTYTQPFNQLSLSPSYKWITAHIGYASMSFSPWSLSGHTFFGGGLDLTPGSKLKINAMYGRLQKKSVGDSIYSVDPAYRRMGTGLKVSYQFGKVTVGVSAFYAADDDNYFYEADSAGILPEENLVLGMNAILPITNKLKLTLEGCRSYLAANSRTGDVTDWSDPNIAVYNAYKAAFNWSTRYGQIGVSTARLDPGYETLGAYYTTNDYVNYTVNFSTSLLKQKVSLAVNTGIEENNLDNKSDQDSENRVLSVQVGFNPSQKVSFSVNYSNFRSYTYIRTVFDETEALTAYELLDTVSYTQLNETVSLSGNYSLGDKDKNPQRIMASFTYQKATSEQSDTPDYSGNDFINASGGYNYSVKPLELSFVASLNYSVNNNGDTQTESIGPLVSARKSFFEKQLKTNLGLSYSQTTVTGESSGNTITGRLGAAYVLKKKHNINFNLAYSSRKTSAKNSNNYSATLGYSYSFSLPKAKSPSEP